MVTREIAASFYPDEDEKDDDDDNEDDLQPPEPYENKCVSSCVAACPSL